MRAFNTAWLALGLVAQPAAAQAAPAAEAVRQQLERLGDVADRPVERDALLRSYRQVPRLLWSDSTGPTQRARAAIVTLAETDRHGLPATRYDAATLRQLSLAVRGSSADAARFDVALSRSLIRFLADLHLGRVDPSATGSALPNAHAGEDVAGALAAAVAEPELSAAIDRMQPRYAGYAALQRALARYRVLAQDTSLRAPRRAATTIRPGDHYVDVPALARLLGALGDLTPAAPGTDSLVNALVYDGALADAVERFQRRHGLEPDTALGRATMAQLRVPLSRRVRQLELAMERWRWLPDRAPSRLVFVNAAAFTLDVFEDDSIAERPRLSMRVIVGQADGRHQTPTFSATMREVVFRPYWDVPPRIARLELIPMFRRQPTAYDRDGFEIVRRGVGDVDAMVYAPTAENFARVIRGELRLRQRPGTENALGLVKFLFPNPYNVYLHDTPTKDLFARSRRDFSHGCIRVARPADLAELVLRGQPSWTREAIDSVMAAPTTLHVTIDQPLAVFIMYTTASAWTGGDVQFLSDLYGSDVRLERALGLSAIASAP